MSGKRLSRDEEEALLVSDVAFLRKPFDLNALHASLRAVLPASASPLKTIA